MIFKPLPLVLFLCLTVTGCSKNPSESGSNRPPGTPVNPAPADGAVNQVVNPTLSWVCTDPDNDALIYDIYLGTQAAPPLLVSAFTSCSYHPSPLQYDTKYYWKIVAKDGMQHEIPGPVWSFMTMNQPSGVYTVSTFDAFCYINSVTVSGNYAYLGTANNNGLRILDISNPLSPREVGRIGNHETVGVMDISNNLAFLWCYGGNYASWMDIIDISNPASPSLKASYTPWQNRYLGDIEVSDGYAYLCLSTDYVEIVNIANSTNPIHQSVIYGISSTSTATADIFGHYLYVAGTEHNYLKKLSVIDISNPLLPRVIGTCIAGYQGGSVNDICIAGDFAYIGVYHFGLVIINISNPASPVVVGAYQVPGDGLHLEDYRIVVKGGLAYLAGRYGLDIIDVIVPSNPTRKARWQTDAGGGCSWVCVMDDYIFVTSGKLYILKYIP